LYDVRLNSPTPVKRPRSTNLYLIGYKGVIGLLKTAQPGNGHAMQAQFGRTISSILLCVRLFPGAHLLSGAIEETFVVPLSYLHARIFAQSFP
jgi:hypothetical protein